MSHTRAEICCSACDDREILVMPCNVSRLMKRLLWWIERHSHGDVVLVQPRRYVALENL